MKHRGLLSMLMAAICLSALLGCASSPETGGINSSLMELPISFGEEEAARADVDILPEQPVAGSEINNSPEEGETVKASVIAGGVRLRQGPGIAAASLSRVARGTDLRVQEIREDGWCLVETPDGDQGYVWAPLLRIEGRKFSTALYKGVRLIRVADNYYLGPDGIKRSSLEVKGLDFENPLKSMKLTSRFGIRKKHPVNGGRNKMHQGVDLKANVGTSVLAAASGIVKSIKRGPNYGLYVDIKHKLGFTTRYAHLSRTLVKKGQRVKAGELIARSGNTGATTGPHLHFELHKMGKSINPLRHVSASR